MAFRLKGERPDTLQILSLSLFSRTGYSCHTLALIFQNELNASRIVIALLPNELSETQSAYYLNTSLTYRQKTHLLPA